MHKKDPEMKDTLNEIKNNLQGIIRWVDESENEISDLQYKEAKNKEYNVEMENELKKG